MRHIQSERETFASSPYIQQMFGPRYQPGHDQTIDNAANAHAMWSGRLADRNYDELSRHMIDAVDAAGFGHHEDPWDAAGVLQHYLRGGHR